MYRSIALLMLVIVCVAKADTRTGTLRVDGKIVAENFKLERQTSTSEVKPLGTLLDLWCGEPSFVDPFWKKRWRGAKVCQSFLSGKRDQNYIVISQGTRTLYVRAQSVNVVLNKGTSVQAFSGYAIDRHPNANFSYLIEKQLQLTLMDSE